METKNCPCCGAIKPVSDFYLNKGRRDGLSPYCVPCSRETERQSLFRLKAKAVEHLGGSCQVCGFTDVRALQVDHVEGGGNKRRQNGEGAGRSTYNLVLKADPGEYQLLCANCNWIKRYENDELVGKREYKRTEPTARRRISPEEEERRRLDANRRRGETNAARTRERDDRIVMAFSNGVRKKEIMLDEGMTYGAVHAVLKRRGLIGNA